MRISTRTRYALRLLIDLALAEGQRFVSIKQISREQGISLRYAEQILLALKNAGYLGSRRGVGGGFYFVKNPDEINIYDIYRVLDGEPALAECMTEEGCEREEICASAVVWRDIQRSIIEGLKRHTLGELIKIQKQLLEQKSAEKWKGSYI